MIVTATYLYIGIKTFGALPYGISTLLFSGSLEVLACAGTGPPQTALVATIFLALPVLAPRSKSPDTKARGLGSCMTALD